MAVQGSSPSPSEGGQENLLPLFDSAQELDPSAQHLRHLVVADSEEDEDVVRHRCRAEQPSSSRGLHKGFIYARDLLFGKGGAFSPGFRSAAAMAGWDDESLLLASHSEGDGTNNCQKKKKDEGQAAGAAEEEEEEASSPPPAPARHRRHDLERKRQVRTPKQAMTPLSAGRKNRKPRRHALGGCSPEALPVADLNLNQELDMAVASQPNNMVKEISAITAITVADSQVCVNKDGGEQEGKVVPMRQSTDKVEEKEKASPSLAQPESAAAAAESTEIEPKPTCLVQLRDELSCAICLEVCFEPSTTSCGHSFCRSCLQSVLQKCSHRCPRCRQTLKGGDASKMCPVNVVLWNTIQILFPKECSARAQVAADQQKLQRNGKGSRTKERLVTASSSSSLERSARSSSASSSGRTLRRWEITRPFQPPAAIQMRLQQGATVLVSDEEAETEHRGGGNYGGGDSRRRRSSRRGAIMSRQEELDAALAMRLQQAELMGSGWGDNGNAEDMQSRTLSATASYFHALASRSFRNSERNSNGRLRININ